ncbi:MAG TPA: metallophosphoesterase family protein [Cyclobacteriaceae bacterium]
MIIGLISDTHGHVDDKVFNHFKDVDEIWHAGDIGDKATLRKLTDFKPVKAVFGNIDPNELQLTLPEDLWFTCNGLEVMITHIGGYPPKYNKRIRKILEETRPGLFICGHSHILKIMTDAERDNMLYINPGAAGNQGFHLIKTLVKFSIENSKLTKLQVIELGRRG